jgi:hypothetical protein
MTETSTAGVFAFDVPAHQPSIVRHPTTDNSSNERSQDHVTSVRHQAKDNVIEHSLAMQEMNKASLAAL